MRKSFLFASLLVLLLLSARDLKAQAYGPFYYNPYWDFQYQQYQHYLQWQQYLAYLQQYDPYYELHLMHYQLYLQPYQSYLIYPPCCYGAAVIIPERSVPISPRSRPGMGPRPRPQIVSPRSQAAVTPLPRAVGPLPGALPRATRRSR